MVWLTVGTRTIKNMTTTPYLGGRTSSMLVNSTTVYGAGVESPKSLSMSRSGADHAVSCSLLVSFTPTRYGPTTLGAAGSGAPSTALDFASGAVPGLSSVCSSSCALTAAIKTYGYTSCTCTAWMPGACIVSDPTCVTCSTRTSTNHAIDKGVQLPPFVNLAA